MTGLEAAKILEEGIKKEGSAIILYSQHIANTLFLSGLEKDKEAQIRKILDKLLVDSQRHKEALEKLIEAIKTSGQNV